MVTLMIKWSGKKKSNEQSLEAMKQEEFSKQLRDMQLERFDVRYKAWIKDWSEADYSWQGLANIERGFLGFTQSLQDHIRQSHGSVNDQQLIDDGKLVELEDGRLFHIAFCPTFLLEQFFKDGELDDLQARRIEFFRDKDAERVVDWADTGLAFPKECGTDYLSSKSKIQQCLFEGSINVAEMSGNIEIDECVILGDIYGSNGAESKITILEIRNCAIMSSLKFDHFTLDGDVRLTESVLGNGFWTTNFSVNEINVWESDLGAVRMTDQSSEGKLSFFSCSIARGIEVTASRFRNELTLAGGVIEGFFIFNVCDFGGRVIMADFDLQAPIAETVSLTGCRFSDVLSIAGVRPTSIRLLADIFLESGLILSLGETPSIKQSVMAEIKSIRSDRGVNSLQTVADIESGCRTVRKYQDDVSNFHSGQFWHKMELLARRSRDDVGAVEKVSSHAYGVISDYGISIMRPFLALIVSVIVFASVYAYFGADAQSQILSWNDASEGLGYSLNRMLPIGVFGNAENAWRDILTGSGGSLGSIGIRTIATAQTVVSAVLIYLGVMAVRRKFKIN